GQLLHRARPDDRRGDGGVGEQPGERDVGGRLAELAAEGLVRLELRAVPLDALLQPFARPAALLRLLERAAEQAARERAPRNHPDAVRAARGEHLQLDRARAQVVEALLGDEPEEVARRRPGVRLRELPAVRPLAHRGIDLGGEDDRLAAAAALREPAADDLLGDAIAAAPAVDVCRVEEVEAGLARAVHEREAVALAGERAEVHGPEAEAADAQPGAAEMDVLHGRCPSTPSWIHAPGVMLTASTTRSASVRSARPRATATRRRSASRACHSFTRLGTGAREAGDGTVHGRDDGQARSCA